MEITQQVLSKGYRRQIDIDDGETAYVNLNGLSGCSLFVHPGSGATVQVYMTGSNPDLIDSTPTSSDLLWVQTSAMTDITSDMHDGLLTAITGLKITAADGDGTVINIVYSL